MKVRFALLVVLMLAMGAIANAQDGAITLNPLGTYETGIFDEGVQEIGAYDAESQRLFVTNADANRIDVLDISDPANPTLINDFTLDAFGDSINSVAVKNGVVAIAVEGPAVDSEGTLVFTDVDGDVLSSVTVGVLPDMVTFTPDGRFVLTANEAEPNDDYTIDPEGTVSIIDISGGVDSLSDDAVTTVRFVDFNADAARADELPGDVRIFGPDATVAQDLEPEYVAVSPDSSRAFVSLQENNAVAVIDIADGSVISILALGFKDYSVDGNGIDASNEDGEVNIRPVPVFGMYQPDALASYEVDGTVYFVTANEGDARDYDSFSEEARIGDEEVALDEEAFPNAAELKDETNLGRLLITTTLGDTDGDGDFDMLYNYGARSFTIFTAGGDLVFDSGNEFETITADLVPEAFNSQGTADSFDNRSDDKGPEPEGIVLGEVDGTSYAFIGLERIGGVMVYDITDPTAPAFVQYINNANLDGSAEERTAGDVGPEGLVFISAEDSPVGTPLLAVTNEVSGSTTIYEIVSQ